MPSSATMHTGERPAKETIVLEASRHCCDFRPTRSLQMKIDMSRSITSVVLAVTCAVGLAHAGSCYEIVDAANQVVYQAPVPPTRLAIEGTKRFHDQLSARGHHLRWYETYNCIDKSALSIYGSRKSLPPGTFNTDLVLRNTPPFGITAIGSDRR